MAKACKHLAVELNWFPFDAADKDPSLVISTTPVVMNGMPKMHCCLALLCIIDASVVLPDDDANCSCSCIDNWVELLLTLLVQLTALH